VTSDAIDLKRLIAPAVVIDVSAQAARDADYRLTVADVNAFERAHGRIAAGTIVLLRTGWSSRWPDAKRYLGDDTPVMPRTSTSRATAGCRSAAGCRPQDCGARR
jgi:kynurenine formamidase